MPGWWADSSRTVSLTAAWIGGVVLILGIAFALSRKLRRRIPAEELERRRRTLVYQYGKLGDGEIIDLDGTTILYSYYVAGVNYATSQDIGTLPASIPSDRMAVIGPVAIRFLTSNPANSIVVCEEWSGLRNRDLHPAKRG